jgi:hypothetical protein
MSCCASENCCRRSVSFLFWAVALAAGVAVVASLPEIKRYIKISSM